MEMADIAANGLVFGVGLDKVITALLAVKGISVIENFSEEEFCNFTNYYSKDKHREDIAVIVNIDYLTNKIARILPKISENIYAVDMNVDSSGGEYAFEKITPSEKTLIIRMSVPLYRFSMQTSNTIIVPSKIHVVERFSDLNIFEDPIIKEFLCITVISSTNADENPSTILEDLAKNSAVDVEKIPSYLPGIYEIFTINKRLKRSLIYKNVEVLRNL